MITIILFAGISYSYYQVTKSSSLPVYSLTDDEIFTVDVSVDEEKQSIITRMTNTLIIETLTVHIEIDAINDSTQLIYDEEVELNDTIEIISSADLANIRKFVVRTSALNGYAIANIEIENPYYNEFPPTLLMAEPTSVESTIDEVTDDVIEDDVTDNVMEDDVVDDVMEDDVTDDVIEDDVTDDVMENDVTDDVIEDDVTDDDVIDVDPENTTEKAIDEATEETSEE